MARLTILNTLPFFAICAMGIAWTSPLTAREPTTIEHYRRCVEVGLADELGTIDVVTTKQCSQKDIVSDRKSLPYNADVDGYFLAARAKSNGPWHNSLVVEGRLVRYNSVLNGFDARGRPGVESVRIKIGRFIYTMERAETEATLITCDSLIGGCVYGFRGIFKIGSDMLEALSTVEDTKLPFRANMSSGDIFDAEMDRLELVALLERQQTL